MILKFFFIFFFIQSYILAYLVKSPTIYLNIHKDIKLFEIFATQESSRIPCQFNQKMPHRIYQEEWSCPLLQESPFSIALIEKKNSSKQIWSNKVGIDSSNIAQYFIYPEENHSRLTLIKTYPEIFFSFQETLKHESNFDLDFELNSCNDQVCSQILESQLCSLHQGSIPTPTFKCSQPVKAPYFKIKLTFKKISSKGEQIKESSPLPVKEEGPKYRFQINEKGQISIE